MSRVGELLAELSPGGVEYRNLGELGEIIRGRRFTKSDVAVEGLPSIHYGEIYTTYGISAITTVSHVRADLRPQLRFAKPGDVVIAAVGETVEDVGRGVAWLGEVEVAVHDDCFMFRSTLLDPKFVAYFLRTESLIRQKDKYIARAKVNRIAGDSIAKLRIPVPPIEVQREIVRILDQFTQLEAELEAELEARRTQYDYYAEELLSVDADTPRVRFGDVATVVRGASPRPIQQFITDAEDGAPWIKIGDVPPDGKYITGTAQRVTLAGAAKSRRVLPGDFVLSNSMSFGRPYISKIEGYIHDGWLAISGFEESYVADYLYYLLRSAPIQDEFKRRAGAGTVQNLNAEIVRSVEIPLPPQEVQIRVVKLLDRFDTLLNDISIGLPAELNARRKQYEYYRDKLLAFREAE
ncbi:restriction endonuclease subunit S [Agromyces tropicus]|uniref:Restriction endonuclease subunit S n=1 Tax=Agromyces tropicus TaxID=555371 RepID=A0ABN2UFB1_9MICO